jgi:hypothetical protein
MRRPHALLCLALSAALCSGAAWAQAYKWKDAQGRTHYTDTPPPPDAHSVTEKKLRGNVVDTSGSYAEQEAMRRAPVTVWLGNECDALCESALALMKARAIPYTTQRITTEEQKKAFAGKFKQKEARVPAINAGADQLVGFSESAWTALLDRAGYPAKGSAKPQPPAKSVPAPAAAETAGQEAEDTPADDSAEQR